MIRKNKFVACMWSGWVVLAILVWAFQAFAATPPTISRALSATTYVSTEGGHGSGVIVGPGRVLTNRHVIEGASQVTVSFSNGKVLPAQVLWQTEGEYDLALLAVPTNGLRPAPVNCRPVSLGDKVFAVGNPLHLRDVVTFGRVAQSGDMLPGTATIVSRLLDLTIIPGNSGGGVWNEQGEVVGIASAILLMPHMIGGTSGLSLMIPTTAICPLLGR